MGQPSSEPNPNSKLAFQAVGLTLEISRNINNIIYKVGFKKGMRIDPFDCKNLSMKTS